MRRRVKVVVWLMCVCDSGQGNVARCRSWKERTENLISELLLAFTCQLTIAPLQQHQYVQSLHIIDGIGNQVVTRWVVEQ